MAETTNNNENGNCANRVLATVTFAAYLIMVGIRSAEYTYTDEELFGNTKYFRKCYNANLSAYKALLFLDDYIKGDYTI